MGDEERKADVGLWDTLQRFVYDYVILSRRRRKRDPYCLVWNVGSIRDNWALMSKAWPQTMKPVLMRGGRLVRNWSCSHEQERECVGVKP